MPKAKSQNLLGSHQSIYMMEHCRIQTHLEPSMCHASRPLSQYLLKVVTWSYTMIGLLYTSLILPTDPTSKSRKQHNRYVPSTKNLMFVFDQTQTNKAAHRWEPACDGISNSFERHICTLQLTTPFMRSDYVMIFPYYSLHYNTTE
jgi:hypothetical protein